MSSSRESSTANGLDDVASVPATFEDRVSWALKHGRVCVFEDHDEVNADILPIDKSFDREIVHILQKKYEEDYKAKRVEMVRKRIAERERQKLEAQKKEKIQKKEKKKMADEEILELFRKRFPNHFIEKSSKNATPKHASKRVRNDSDDSDDSDTEGVESTPSPTPKKIARQVNRNTNDDQCTLDLTPTSSPVAPFGAERNPPCETCRRKEKTCHDQGGGAGLSDRVCYECRRGRIACPDNATMKARKEEEKKKARLLAQKTTPKAAKPWTRSKSAATRRRKRSLEGSNNDDNMIFGGNTGALAQGVKNLETLKDTIETGFKAVAEYMKLQAEKQNEIAADIRRILDIQQEKLAQDVFGTRSF